MIEAWMDYERARLTLFRDMGTMAIDDRGIWSRADQQTWVGGIETLPMAPPEELPSPLLQ